MCCNTPRSLFLAFLICATSASVPAFAKAPAPSTASPSAKAMVAYRSLLMQEMGKDMKLANMLTSGQVDRPADLVGFAAALQNAPIGELFPAGTGPDVLETGAKAALWTDPEGFAKAVKTYQEKATALSAAAQAGDMATAKAAAKELGTTCSGCHDLYRMED